MCIVWSSHRTLHWPFSRGEKKTKKNFKPIWWRCKCGIVWKQTPPSVLADRLSVLFRTMKNRRTFLVLRMSRALLPWYCGCLAFFLFFKKVFLFSFYQKRPMLTGDFLSREATALRTCVRHTAYCLWARCGPKRTDNQVVCETFLFTFWQQL